MGTVTAIFWNSVLSQPNGLLQAVEVGLLPTVATQAGFDLSLAAVVTQLGQEGVDRDTLSQISLDALRLRQLVDQGGKIKDRGREAALQERLGSIAQTLAGISPEAYARAIANLNLVGLGPGMFRFAAPDQAVEQARLALTPSAATAKVEVQVVATEEPTPVLPALLVVPAPLPAPTSDFPFDVAITYRLHSQIQWEVPPEEMQRRQAIQKNVEKALRKKGDFLKAAILLKELAQLHRAAGELEEEAAVRLKQAEYLTMVGEEQSLLHLPVHYLVQGDYQAAAEGLENVLAHYESTDHVEEETVALGLTMTGEKKSLLQLPVSYLAQRSYQAAAKGLKNVLANDESTGHVEEQVIVFELASFAWHRYGLEQWQAGNLDEAFVALDRALYMSDRSRHVDDAKDAPKIPDVEREAFEEFQALEKEAKEAMAGGNYARAVQALESAVEAMRNLIGLHDASKKRLLVMESFYNIRDFYHEQIDNLRERLGDALELHGYSLLQAKDYAGAVAVFQKTGVNKAWERRSKMWLVVAFAKMGNESATKSSAKESADSGSSPWTQIEYALSAIAKGYTAGGIGILERHLIFNYKLASQLLALQGSVDRNSIAGQMHERVNGNEAMTGLVEDLEAILFVKGVELSQREQYVQAAIVFKKLASLKDKPIHYQLWYGLAAAKAGDYLTALAVFGDRSGLRRYGGLLGEIEKQLGAGWLWRRQELPPFASINYRRVSGLLNDLKQMLLVSTPEGQILSQAMTPRP